MIVRYRRRLISFPDHDSLITNTEKNFSKKITDPRNKGSVHNKITQTLTVHDKTLPLSDDGPSEILGKTIEEEECRSKQSSLSDGPSAVSTGPDRQNNVEVSMEKNRTQDKVTEERNTLEIYTEDSNKSSPSCSSGSTFSTLLGKQKNEKG